MSQKRTYPSGAEKRKRKKEEEEKKCRDKGALLKYFGGTEAAQWQSASSGSTVCNPSELAPPSCVPNVPSVSATTDDLPELTPPSCVPTVPSVSATTDDLPGPSTSSTELTPQLVCPLSPLCLQLQMIYLQPPPQRPLLTTDHHQLHQWTQLSGLLFCQIQTGLSSAEWHWEISPASRVSETRGSMGTQKNLVNPTRNIWDDLGSLQKVWKRGWKGPTTQPRMPGGGGRYTPDTLPGCRVLMRPQGTRAYIME
ncbi:uncharacterized protein LOC126989218 isoform X3 [Eriocheir sinensis]|uniref:uncharacterized protein LOC126989218 isoform X3 n=1 Tax=Eriocheir sinensis TaxID=95602 RepID=UPI0021CADC62|nr:uncharacterized protein LOC126989218 isoform X3 [Eriocheir sinensis]